MNPDLLQKFLVLAGELSYMEEAPETHLFISGFLDVCRHCDSKAQSVSLYAELSTANTFIEAFKKFFPLYADIKVENCEEYKVIDIEPGEAIRLLYALTQETPVTPDGKLIWDSEACELRYLPRR